MTVAAIQHDIAWEDPPANREQLAPRIAEAAERGARLVLLSELWPTGFSMAAERLAETLEGPSTGFLVDCAARHRAWVGGSVAVRPAEGDRPRNCFVLAAPDGTVHRYAKRHTFTYAGEHEHFEAGRDALTVDVDGVRCTLAVCYDLRFGPDFWDTAADTGCYLVVANWPAARKEHWRTLLRARAIENQTYVVGVNRVGTDPHGAYAGDSAVVDPSGATVADAGGDDCVLVADVDPERVRDSRTRYPFVADRARS